MSSNATDGGIPPPAAYANLPHDDKRRSTLLSIWCLAALSLAFLVARLLCKLCTRRRLWWDDHVMVLAWAALAASVALSTWSIALGEGQHVWDVDPAHFGRLGLLGNLTGTFSILAAVWSKTSFALTLLRLLSGHPRLRALLWLAIGSMNVAMGLNALFLWVRCAPVAKTWNPAVPGTCWAPQVYPIYGIFAAGYSAVMDFVLALLPWKIVWQLQMRRPEKLGVAVAMSLGVVAGATAIVKTSQIPTLSSADFTFVMLPLVVWGAAESAVTIMAASIPVLRVLLRDAHQLTLRHYIVSAGTGGGTDVRTADGAGAGGGEEMQSVVRREQPTKHRRDVEHGIDDDERALRSVGSQQTVRTAREATSKEGDMCSIRVALCDDGSSQEGQLRRDDAFYK
ncbi:hypothetical protein HMPREF1624_01625 [Sporothrix schenckii ATCC 58251]|uniref:Rhodopsin domain-containing protein n=1 Tax=Sporothrix schenckii (strain ATCC 58251 / de Perez 2211183) TaxID=1391915 RepID=U7Q5Z2_SPOS1|nr:hypothetical protein HMPREF1624_01625 [Sporothrix schenckii ATCC 58251]